jgi:hypothetical protein
MHFCERSINERCEQHLVDFTSGANSVISGNVYVTGDNTLGAGSKVLGSVHSRSGVFSFGAGSVAGSVK